MMLEYLGVGLIISVLRRKPSLSEIGDVVRPGDLIGYFFSRYNKEYRVDKRDTSLLIFCHPGPAEKPCLRQKKRFV